MLKKYVVECYDKDNDLYERSKEFDNLDDALSECKKLDKMILNNELLSSSNEPYDWCIITEFTNERQTNLFTYHNDQVRGMAEKLEDFCFDTICDFVSSKNILIEQDRKGDWRVIVLRGLTCPRDVLYDEWNAKTKNTEFENVGFYLPTK